MDTEPQLCFLQDTGDAIDQYDWDRRLPTLIWASLAGVLTIGCWLLMDRTYFVGGGQDHVAIGQGVKGGTDLRY